MSYYCNEFLKMTPNAEPDRFFDPSTCTYKLSGTIRKQIDDLVVSDSVSDDTKSVLRYLLDQEESNKSTLNYDMIVELHKYLQRADRDYMEPFYLFVEKCKCIEPRPRENKVLEDRLRRLRLESSKSLYNSMASSVDRSVKDRIESDPESNLSANIYSKTANNQNASYQRTTTTHYTTEFRKLNGSVVAVFNSFLVFICTFIFCYKALEYSLASPNIIAQVVFGLAGSTVVAFAELYFLIRVI